MPKYIKKLLQRFKHIAPEKPIHTTYKPPPKKYGSASQTPAEEDTSEQLDKHGIQEIKKIVRTIVY